MSNHYASQESSLPLIIYTHPSNLFGSEDSWRLVSRRFHRFYLWLVTAVMSHMLQKSYLQANKLSRHKWLLTLDWSIPSWVICAPKVISQEEILKAQMTPDFNGWRELQPSGLLRNLNFLNPLNPLNPLNLLNHLNLLNLLNLLNPLNLFLSALSSPPSALRFLNPFFRCPLF